MKRMIVLAVVMLGCWGTVPFVQAAPAKDPGPEFINLKNGPEPLRFSHRKHQELQGSDCSQCHYPDKWTIDDWGKETAHAMCISCHDLNEKGPVKCGDCHKK